MRHEYIDGRLYAFAGATARHNEIIMNLVARIHPALRGTGCHVLAGTVKLRVADSVIYYPDLMVVCDPTDDDPLIRHRPCLIVEVLSPSTEQTDRREKLFAYRQLPSLLTYLIVDQERRIVQREFRDERGQWTNAVVSERGIVPLGCPPIELTLDDIYEAIDVSTR